ncbi:MAG: chorismate mutase [Bacillota bacterium]|nr:chorismate mutase [Bacillota bacterium]MDD3299096.1 chorismate mutase [Bacillota bacterium]MDD3850880.1 chorismate mutase [Bacillota bacterium]MDD4707837.1 chorismate mutase [Bacillota bacterium]
MSTAAIRGAITVEKNSAFEIEKAAVVLLEHIIQKNNLQRNNIAFLFFTCTRDLDSQYPAAGIRHAGYTEIPMMCVAEMPVKDSLERCIRILVVVNADGNQEVRHVYLEGAKKLRPDLSD